MKAIRWHARNDVRIDEVPEPRIQRPSDVILAVEATGICGSDLEEIHHGPVSIPVDTPNPLTGVIAPVTLGHEIVGRIVDAGSESTYGVGTRVAPTPVIWCGRCAECLAGAFWRCTSLAVVGLSHDGGFAIYVRVDAGHCVVVDETLPAPLAALVEPYAVAIHSLSGIDVAGRTVGVVGFGSVGACVADVAKSQGASRMIVMDPDPEARSRAIDAGADQALDPNDQPETLGLSVVIEASGAVAGLRTAISNAGSAGRVVVVGLRGGEVPVPLPAIVYGEIHIVGRVGHDLDELNRAASGLSTGKFARRYAKPHTVGFTEALELLRNGRHAISAWKTVLDPSLS